MENQESTPHSRKDISMDGVLDELRSVISGLNGRGSPSSPEQLPPEEPPIQAATPKPEPLTEKAEELSTDDEFWKGNVLGWPSNPEPTVPAAVPNLADQHFFSGEMNNPPPLDVLSPPPVPFAAPPPPPPPTPPPPPPPVTLSYEKPALEGANFSLDTPFLNPDAARVNRKPEPLPEPEPQPEPIAEPEPLPLPVPPTEEEKNPWSLEELIPEVPIAPSVRSAPPVPEVEEMEVPIPGTLQMKEPDIVKEVPDNDLDLEGTQLKPAGFFQIACFFPEGQERPSQQFVNKLKEQGSQSKAALKIEPVFVNAWPVGNPDPASWIKSAKLSGADAIFILGPKKEIDQFKPLMADAIRAELRARLVPIEQIGLRTLYADIMIELERGR